MSSSNWIYQRNGRPAPDHVSAEELSALRELRVIQMNTLVRRDQPASPWLTLEEVWNNPIPVVPDAEAVERMARRLGVQRVNPEAGGRVPFPIRQACHLPVAPPPPDPPIIPPAPSWDQVVGPLLRPPPASKPKAAPPPTTGQMTRAAAAGPGVPPPVGVGNASRTKGPNPSFPGTSCSPVASPPTTVRPPPPPPRPPRRTPSTTAAPTSPQVTTPGRRRRRRSILVPAVAMLALLAISGWILLRMQENDGRHTDGPMSAPDGFRAGLQRAISAVGQPDWQALRAFNELLLQNPARESELIPHVTNHLNFAAALLQLPSPEFALTTNVIIAAAEAGCLPAQRLLVRGAASAGLDPLRQAWLARVASSLAPELHALTVSLGATNIGTTLDSYHEFLGRSLEIESLILSNCCVALGQLERGEITEDIHTRHQDFLHRIASNGCSEADRLLADRELPIDSKRQEVYQHYLAAAHGGSVHSLYQLGQMAARGMIDGAPNWTNAYAWFERAASAGSIAAKYELASILFSTNSLPQISVRERAQKGIALLDQICRIPSDSRLARSDVRKYERALVALGTILLKAQFGQTGRIEEGLSLLERAAKRTNEEACLLLGVHLVGLDYVGRVSTARSDFSSGVGYLETAAASANLEIAKNALLALTQTWKYRDTARAEEYEKRRRNLVSQAP